METVPEIKIIPRAAELPENWDSLALDYFQTIEFLNHTEKYNPCRQRYYVLSLKGIFKAGIVVYTLKLDLLTYLSISSPIRMNIAGIPCSVSSSGFVGDREFFQQLIRYIQTIEKGLLLVLNVEPELRIQNMISGKTLPTILFTRRSETWDDYLGSLRASYRRRIRLFSDSFTGICKKQLACSSFDSDMYLQYLQVLKRSKGKLETLPIGFFMNLPSNFCLHAFYHKQRLIGWYITTTFSEKFYFFLGGIDYNMNRQFDTYFNILLSVLQDGIEKKVTVIDLGQTAEIPKIRLGGDPVEKTMLAYHSNRLILLLLKVGKRLLEYSTAVKEAHVFKEMK